MAQQATNRLDFLPPDGEMAALIRNYDWAGTPLGDPSRWSTSLRMMVRFMLANRFPHLLWWGPEYIQLYNDYYIPILGTKHPRAALGERFKDCWHEVYHILGPLVDTPFNGGPSTWTEDIELIVRRHGLPEESHFMFSYSPVPDDTAPRGIGGVLATVHEITEKVIAERRVKILSELGARVAEAKTDEQACVQAIDILAQYPKDIPFALIYLVDAARRELRLVSTTGISAVDVGPPTLGVGMPDADVPWPLTKALDTETLQLREELSAVLPRIPPGPWPDPPDSAAVIPIKSNIAGRPAGALVVGISSCIRPDSRYLGFLDLLGSQIAIAVANVRAYEEERRRAEALAEIDRVKTTFFSNVSHEFRTPLTLMLGPLEDALSAREIPPPVRNHLEVAQRNAQRLLKLVNSLLDFSRIESGRIQASFEAVDLEMLTENLSSTFRSAMQRARLEFEVDCKPLGEPVYVDRDMWEKIVLNLLSNAFKFTMEGGVRVRLDRGEGHAVLEVSDTGVGVAEHQLSRLFERFYRVEETKSRSYEGSGIGLALVQELVNLHGGLIEVNSQLGVGTTFRVRIPFGAAHIPAERIKRESSKAATAVDANPYVQEALHWLPDPVEKATSSAIALTDGPDPKHDTRFAATFGARVLLADDNSDMRSYVRELLKPCYDVETVADGSQALEAARRSPPDLVLADVMMPKLDGFALLAALRADRQLRDIPVIMLSARAGEESRIEGLGAGADDYMVKPFHARELLARVGAILELTALRREAEERFRAYIQASSDVVYRMNADWTEMRHLEGRSFIADQADPSRTWLQKYIREDDQPHVLAAIHDAIRKKSVFELEHSVIRADGSTGWILSRAIPVFNDDGEILEWFGAATDITERRERREAEQAAAAVVREERRSLEVLNRAGAELASETELRRVVQIVTDAGVELTGAQFGAFFYNIQDERGESYMLYTLSGAPVEAFSKFPTPRNTAVFGPTFAGEGIVRSDDITRDPRYGHNAPFNGMPEGHLPVRSYLAAPVSSRDGVVVGGLFFGHASVGVFSELAEQNLAGLAAQAAVAIDNAYLAQAAQKEIAERTRAEEALRDLNANLEREIAERTDQLRTQEEALRQAQKMEAVGQLTGGVAHDFNNLLQVIVGNLEVIRRLVPSDAGRIQRAAEQAMNGARQASSLTQRLLAFSRRQPLDPKPIDVNSLVGGMSDLLNRSLGETISVETVRGAGLWKAEADPNELEAAILNLAVNARDAMPDGGRLTIETTNAHIDESYATAHAEVLPGQYVALSISDTGVGMDAQTLTRAFEPFFTTKPVGKGTGLGLSQVYGFVKQSGGHVKIYSEVGQGTTVKLYLPRLERSGAESEPQLPVPVPEGTQEETILVVEDDENVRSYSVEALRDLGYRVIEAHDGASALHLLQGQTRFDLLFTDVVLPGGMTGAQVAAAARELHPDLKILFTTGYARNAIFHHGRLDKGVQLITKPFTFTDLAAKIRDVLDGLPRP